MPHSRDFLALGAGILLITATGACADDPDPVEPTQDTAATTTAPTISGEGATDIGDIYGPGCDGLPVSGPGSADAMAEAPVAEAVAGNPMLSTLASAISTAQLGDTLDNADAGYTLFAPTDDAFDALPPGALDELLSEPQGRLTEILTYHVVPQRYDAAGLTDVDEVSTVLGKPLTISGQRESLVVDEDDQATVVCGNIPTANATVFLIDTVLMPPIS